MQKLTIADTSCLILLEKIGELEVLKKLYNEVYITTLILEEYGEIIPKWIKINDPKHNPYQNILYSSIDAGEASAIALAIEQTDCLLILDDTKARTLAKQLNLKFTGTLGVLLEAKFKGHIPSIRIIIEKIKSTNFRISEQVKLKILEKAGEV